MLAERRLRRRSRRGADVSRRLIGNRQAGLPEGDQVAGQVAAVHRGDVRGLEHAQIAEVVPVVEVPAEALEPVERSHRELEAAHHVLDGDEPQIVGAHGGEQLEPDVGGGRPHRHDGRGIDLDVIGREPVRLRRHHPVEERPVELRVAHGSCAVVRRQAPLAPDGGRAQRVGDGRRRHPESDEGKNADRERPSTRPRIGSRQLDREDDAEYA